MNYDPNLTLCGRTATQTVELTFQIWDYSKKTVHHVDGNLTGLDVFSAAVEEAYEGLPTDFGCASLTLMNAEGVEMHCADDENEGYQWLKDMLVKAEIVDIQPTLRD
ncbi:DUF5406 family protein [Marinobacterium sp. BA1]|uniref:DUF5406 family protein n=1 Tax=Marinobacterium sp. BA1 TaxID=3138931 RepID=UPI0032E743ED